MKGIYKVTENNVLQETVMRLIVTAIDQILRHKQLAINCEAEEISLAVYDEFTKYLELLKSITDFANRAIDFIQYKLENHNVLLKYFPKEITRLQEDITYV
jgi:hypothetical protein